MGDILRLGSCSLFPGFVTIAFPVSFATLLARALGASPFTVYPVRTAFPKEEVVSSQNEPASSPYLKSNKLLNDNKNDRSKIHGVVLLVLNNGDSVIPKTLGKNSSSMLKSGENCSKAYNSTSSHLNYLVHFPTRFCLIRIERLGI